MLRIDQCESKKTVVSELRFKAQMIYLVLSETATVAEALERMEATKMQELDGFRFSEWTRDLKGLEFTQIVTVPYEASNVNVVMEDTGPEDRVWVRCASREILAQTQLGCVANVGEAVQVDPRTWCLITADTMKEMVKPVTLEKAWKSLLQQLTDNRNLCLPVFDWYRGQFHFQDWYPLVVACTPADCNVHFHATRVHKSQPAVTVPAALRLVDSWMKINRQDRPLARSIWKDLETISPQRHSKKENRR